MRRVLPIKLALTCLLTACVTVNVYFPAAAAEQAADKIIDKVTGQPAKPAHRREPQRHLPRHTLRAGQQPSDAAGRRWAARSRC